MFINSSERNSQINSKEQLDKCECLDCFLGKFFMEIGVQITDSDTVAYKIINDYKISSWSIPKSSLFGKISVPSSAIHAST